jgi:hypothetical protein
VISDDKIYVDPSQPAILQSASRLIDCPTLGEATIAWHQLPDDDRARAIIRCGNIVYTARDIVRFHCSSTPTT